MSMERHGMKISHADLIGICLGCAVVLGGLVCMFIYIGPVDGNPPDLGEYNSTTATNSTPKSPVKKKPPLPPLTPEELKRKAKLEKSLRKKWQQEDKKIATMCNQTGLSPEHRAFVLRRVAERRKEHLDLLTRKPKSNKEFLKGLSRLYRRYEKEIINKIGRRKYDELASRQPDLFKPEAVVPKIPKK